MNKNHEDFLVLTRLGIGHSQETLSGVVDWESVKGIAYQQGVLAVVLDGIEMLPTNQRPNQVTLLNWIGEVLQSYEQRYESYCQAIAELAKWHNGHGFKMMVLKGYACSIEWPKPKHRPCGDIDIWQFGKQKEADVELEASFKIKDSSFKIDKSHHHHTVFEWMGFTVENHYDFINVHAHQSSVELEKLLKKLGEDDTNSIELNKQKIFLPTPNLHALFLIRHMTTHFASEGITLRQLLDWGFFVKGGRERIDWAWLEGILEEYGMYNMYSIINTICVENLGFDKRLFSSVDYDPIVKERVLNDILSPEYIAILPAETVKRIVYKLRRWRDNAWKRKLCFRESMWNEFWTGVWGHILKPNSI